MKNIWLIGGWMLLEVSTVIATPLGWMGEGDIATVNGLPAVCLPLDAKRNFPVTRFLVVQANTQGKLYWELTLKPDATPVLMQPGKCAMLGGDIEGYESKGDLTVDLMEPGWIYIVRVDRVENKKNPNTFYMADYCVSHNSGTSPEYIDSGPRASAEARARCKALRDLGP